QTAGKILAHEFVIRHPRILAAEMRFDRERLPIVELVGERLARRARLQAERIAAEIRLLGIVGGARKKKLVAERRQRIGRGLGGGAPLGGGRVVRRLHTWRDPWKGDALRALIASSKRTR